MRRTSTWLTACLALSACSASTLDPAQPPAPTAAAAAPTASASSKSVLAGTRYQLSYFTSLHPDCTLSGLPVARVILQPAHGTLTVAQGDDYPAYTKDDQRYGCNLKKSPGVLVFYQSDPNFVGMDTATIEMIFVSATSRTVTYNLAVK